jgi:type I restriction enzyme S subunit
MKAQEWKYVPLGKLTKRIGGGTPSRKNLEYFQGTTPWITVADIPKDCTGIFKINTAREFITDQAVEKSATKRIPPGSVVLATRVSVGKVGISMREICTNQDFTSFPPMPELDSEFLAYLLLHESQTLLSQTRGSTIKGITTNVVDAIEAPLFSLIEQRRIVERIKECLSRVDEIKRLREEVRQEVEEASSSLLTECFDTSWPYRTLGSVAVDIRNGWSGRERKDGKPIKMLRLSSVHSRTIDPTESKEIVLNSTDIGAFRVVKNDVFIVRGNGSKHLVGRSAIADATYEDVVFNDLLIRIRFAPELLPQFANFAFHLPALRRQIEESAKTAAGIWKINQQRLGELLIPCPPLSVQRATLERVDQVLTLWKQLAASVAEVDIDLLPQAILRKAFAGEL